MTERGKTVGGGGEAISVNMKRQRDGGVDLCEQREAKTGGGGAIDFC